MAIRGFELRAQAGAQVLSAQHSTAEPQVSHALFRIPHLIQVCCALPLTICRINLWCTMLPSRVAIMAHTMRRLRPTRSTHLTMGTIMVMVMDAPHVIC